MDNMLDVTSISLVTTPVSIAIDLLNRGFEEGDIHSELMRHDRTFQQHVHHTYFRLRHLRDGEIDIRSDAWSVVWLPNNVNEPLDRTQWRGSPFPLWPVFCLQPCHQRGRWRHRQLHPQGSLLISRKERPASSRPDFMYHLLE